MPIQRGEHIFASYALSLDGIDNNSFSYIDNLLIEFGLIIGTKERRAILRQSKFFECDCCRCSDPTEGSTFMSALRCRKCPTGVVLPIRPLDESETEWRCHLCSYKLASAVVTRAVDKLKEEFEAIGANEVDK